MEATQEIKSMIDKARRAQSLYASHFDQDDVDAVVKLATRAIFDNAEMLAKMAVEETQMGVYEDKVMKNRNKSKGVYFARSRYTTITRIHNHPIKYNLFSVVSIL